MHIILNRNLKLLYITNVNTNFLNTKHILHWCPVLVEWILLLRHNTRGMLICQIYSDQTRILTSIVTILLCALILSLLQTNRSLVKHLKPHWGTFVNALQHQLTLARQTWLYAGKPRWKPCVFLYNISEENAYSCIYNVRNIQWSKQD